MAASPPGAALTAYVGRLIALRREHPVLRRPDFLQGRAYAAPVPPTSRGSQSGATISAAAWNDIEQRTLILRRSMRITGGKITILSLLLNPEDRQCDFRLPPPCLWSRVLLDSAEADAWERPLAADSVNVAAHSAVLLCSEYAG
ncbi:MAG TPA: hypothetical protein VKI44_04080 [Acetobacteraceae bacterium]|nr:hypothetical protein [Acetobacteraceae bacterium]